MNVNPYQPVIDWLRTPEGERWSENRLHRAFRNEILSGGPGWRPTFLHPDLCGPVCLVGVFNIKEG